MKFTETRLEGAFIIEPQPMEDNRGFFARVFCRHEFDAHGLNPELVQCNISLNLKKGTLRGLHYQASPYEEEKLVRVTKGAIFDVIVDLRPKSPTFKQWLGVDLTAENRKTLYIPKGFAHGFQTLTDDTEVFYQMSHYFHAESSRGVAWDSPEFAIDWPVAEKILSEKDRNQSSAIIF